MTHPLFLQIASTQGMRELLTARLFHSVRHIGRRARVEHDGVLRITIWLDWTAWLTLGLLHLIVWLEVRKLAKDGMRMLKIHSELKVKIR